jgi:hypothetical protein
LVFNERKIAIKTIKSEYLFKFVMHI